MTAVLASPSLLPPSGVQSAPVAIFAATRWELNAVRKAFICHAEQDLAGVQAYIGQYNGLPIHALHMGIGLKKAGLVGRSALDANRFGLIISTGFACALRTASVGDLLVGTEVVALPASEEAVHPLTVFPCSVEHHDLARRTADASGLPVHSGRFVTTARVLSRADQKKRVAMVTGGVGLDMESAALAAAASERGIPFVVVRAVSDLLDEDLPLDFNLFLPPASWYQGMWACLTSPASLMGLWQLRSHSRKAAAALTVFFERYLEALSCHVRCEMSGS